MDCTTNIGREFLRLLDTHFPQKLKRKDKLEKVINRNTIKLSYSGSPNMTRIISSHNKKILEGQRMKEEPKKMCNCQKGGEAVPKIQAREWQVRHLFNRKTVYIEK